MMGTKKGCAHGQGGACTVPLNRERRVSGRCLAVGHDGAATAVEGLADGENRSPLQRAFLADDAFHCGYCTPGPLCSAQGLQHGGHACPRDEVREQMSRNRCRCGAYPSIASAIRSVLAQPPTP